jgi:ubiquinone/menaquinone biosynthesis C-methylase UbiE
MATWLRSWSYRYLWLYNAISRLAALGVGGEFRFRRLALQGLDLDPQAQVLDLCCGSGQATQILVGLSPNVTGLDASPLSLQRAKQRVPEASFVEAWAEKMPFATGQFDLVHTSMALHEMAPQALVEIFSEVYRVLKPGGIFALVDFHAPTHPAVWPGLMLFLLLFETETAWALLQTDLVNSLQQAGFLLRRQHLFTGGSIQVIQVQKPEIQESEPRT